MARHGQRIWTARMQHAFKLFTGSLVQTYAVQPAEGLLCECGGTLDAVIETRLGTMTALPAMVRRRRCTTCAEVTKTVEVPVIQMARLLYKPTILPYKGERDD